MQVIDYPNIPGSRIGGYAVVDKDAAADAPVLYYSVVLSRCERFVDDPSAILELLEEEGAVFHCPFCNKLNAWSWQVQRTALVNEDAGHFRGDPFARIRVSVTTEAGSVDLYHVGASDCFGQECGACMRYYTPVDSPINADVYAHANS